MELEDLPKLRSLLDAGHDVEDDDGHGWTLLRHAIDAEYDDHVQSGEPLHADVTAFLLARGADPLRPCNGMPVVVEAEVKGHWLAAEIMRAWIGRAHDQALTLHPATRPPGPTASDRTDNSKKRAQRAVRRGAAGAVMITETSILAEINPAIRL